MRKPKHCSHIAARPRAFTLTELLVTMGIIAVLIGLTMPIVSRVHTTSLRAIELSNLHQLTAACLAYSQDNDGALPVGRFSAAPANSDNYTWINYKNCWQLLASLVPNINAINSCDSVRETYKDADDFGVPLAEYGTPDDTKVGWIYWGGRDDLYVNHTLAYRSMRHAGQHLTPGSPTLWTCLCWDSAGNGGPSVCPHVGASCVIYAPGVTLKPPPDGLGISLIDGSASFVGWNDMITIPQANGFKLYYQP